jgi:glycosyltransferase involved in cell wall biosynthesis
MRILLFQKLIPHYRKDFFRRLYDEFGIITCHSKGLKGSSNKSTYQEVDYITELIPAFYYQRRETSLIQNVFPALRRHKPELVITEFSFKYLTFWLLFFLKRVYKYRLILWCHGISNKEQNNNIKSLRNRISLTIYAKADAIIVYSDKRAEVLKKYIDTRKVFVAKNSINMTKNFEIQKRLSFVGKRGLQETQGFKEKHHLVYIGRLTPSKRIDLLIEVFKDLKLKIDVALHIIGDGPEMIALKKAKSEVGNIYLYGEIHDEERIGEILFASDLMIITGAVGLSVLHAFSYGLPVITFRQENGRPYHGPEFELLKDQQNGFLSEQSESIMAENIYSLLTNPFVLNEMQKMALITAKENSVDNMVAGFKDAIKYFNPDTRENYVWDLRSNCRET